MTPPEKPENGSVATASPAAPAVPTSPAGADRPPLEPVWRHPEFRRGMADMAHIGVGIGAWALITGVAMVQSGLSLPLAVLMSLLVYAGSAQLAVLPLIASGSPVWVMWATAACVNLRFLVFSAQWRPYLLHLPLAQRLRIGYFSADLSTAMTMRRFPEPRPHPELLPYFWGMSAVNWCSWQGASLAGILLADRVPVEWGLGFAGVLALLGVACSLLSDKATWVAGAVGGAAAVAAFALPLKLNIVVAIAAAVAIGVLMDHFRPSGPVRAVPLDDRT